MRWRSRSDPGSSRTTGRRRRRALILRGRLREADGQVLAAETDVHEALRQDPKHPFALAMLSRFARDRSDLLHASAVFARIVATTGGPAAGGQFVRVKVCCLPNPRIPDDMMVEWLGGEVFVVLMPGAGLTVASGELVCAVDADTPVEPDAPLRVVRPFIGRSDVIAPGGTIRVVNDCTVHAGRVVSVVTPRRTLAGIQTVEYLRAFTFGRPGWNPLAGNVVISGAFGLFQREAVLRASGYLEETVGEDMELVVRLRRQARERGDPDQVLFVPDSVAWTEVPETWRVLGRQRDRLQRGLADVLVRNRRRRDVWKLIAYALLENLGYRQAMSLVRVRATVRFARGVEGSCHSGSAAVAAITPVEIQGVSAGASRPPDPPRTRKVVANCAIAGVRPPRLRTVHIRHPLRP